MAANSPLLSAVALSDWFDGFVGSDEERAVADALLHVALAVEQIADPRLYPPRLKASPDLAVWMNGVAGAALSELREALDAKQ